MPGSRPSLLARALFAAALLVFALAMSEGVLRVAALLSPAAARMLGKTGAIPLELPDGRLGARPNPEVPDHDPAGYRNASIPERAHVVVLGDSQTYGVGVAREEAWPQQLEQRSHQRVYQIAFGGFGPGHSLVLFPEAERLAPAHVVEALYFGNDLYDAFQIHWVHGQAREFASGDAALRAEIERAQQREPLEQSFLRAARLARGETEPKPEATPGLRDLLSDHSAVYGLLRALQRRVAERTDPAPARRADDWPAQLAKARRTPGAPPRAVRARGAAHVVHADLPARRARPRRRADPRRPAPDARRDRCDGRTRAPRVAASPCS
jgi:hypothetical protein